MAISDASDPWHARPLHDGIPAGLIGGILMALTVAGLFQLDHLGEWWEPFILLGAMARPEWAQVDGFAPSPAIIGGVILLASSLLSGVVLAWLIAFGAGAVARAILVALLLWALDTYVVLPAVDPALVLRCPPWLLAAAHGAFGLGAGAYIAWATPRLIRPRAVVAPVVPVQSTPVA